VPSELPENEQWKDAGGQTEVGPWVWATSTSGLTPPKMWAPLPDDNWEKRELGKQTDEKQKMVGEMLPLTGQYPS
jgi:hypothetical protein